jgi:hypothetical protein
MLLLAWSPAGRSAPSLDLTPSVKEVRADGAVRRLVFFRSAQLGVRHFSLVEYAAPWPISGDREAAIMSVPGMNACASIKGVETAEALDLDDEAAVVEWVSRLVPTGATALHIEQVVRDPVRLNEHGTIEVILTYSFFGRPLQVSAFLCRRKGDYPGEIFLFQLAATPLQFEAAHRTFRASLYSIAGF